MVRQKIAAFLAAAMLLSASPALAEAPYTDLGTWLTARPSITCMTRSA